MEKPFLIPREGVKVRDPSSKEHLPAEGAYRSLNTYYNRRISDGDIIVRTGPAPVIEKKKAAVKATKTTPKKEDGDE